MYKSPIDVRHTLVLIYPEKKIVLLSACARYKCNHHDMTNYIGLLHMTMNQYIDDLLLILSYKEVKNVMITWLSAD